VLNIVSPNTADIVLYMLSNSFLHSTYNILTQIKFVYADPAARAVKDVGLWPLACWDCGFESCRGHGYLSLVNCCMLSGGGLCDWPIPRPEESYRVCVCVCVCVTEFDQVQQKPSTYNV